MNRGRKALNLSEWGNYSTEKKSDLLAEMCKEASDREMPGTPYTSLHAGTRLTDAEIQSVCSSSVVTPKPANGGQGKTGQRKGPGTKLFYPAASCGGKSIFVRQLRGPHLST